MFRLSIMPRMRNVASEEDVEFRTKVENPEKRKEMDMGRQV